MKKCKHCKHELRSMPGEIDKEVDILLSGQDQIFIGDITLELSEYLQILVNKHNNTYPNGRIDLEIEVDSNPNSDDRSCDNKEHLCAQSQEEN